MMSIIDGLGGESRPASPKAPRRLGIYAPGVCTGGGLAQLQAILDEVPDLIAWAVLDARAEGQLALPAGMRGRWLKPSLKERLAAELALHRQLTRPLTKCRARLASPTCCGRTPS
jgi:hypothetical protein